MEKAENITIDQLAEMSQRQFAVIDKRLENLEENMVTKDLFKEGIEMVMGEIRGLRDDMKSEQLASRIIHNELDERIGHVEHDILVLKDGGKKNKKSQ
ncbi:MAG: hypothetical protein HY617_00200 [Candidatus Sungbacteria bacterium]|nr:hypothetical protein [Candidatus Sungbacteria bacterium]